MTVTNDISRRSAIIWVTLATALGAAFRFYGLGWGAPYFHFHIDEHVVFRPEPDHAVVKQYYRDLLDGRLGFKLVKTFKVYPSLFGRAIRDDAAELTFRSFDHPRVFIFMRP